MADRIAARVGGESTVFFFPSSMVKSHKNPIFSLNVGHGHGIVSTFPVHHGDIPNFVRRNTIQAKMLDTPSHSMRLLYFYDYIVHSRF